MCNAPWIDRLPLFLLSGMRIIHSQTDILMVGSLLGTREAGIYAVAARIAESVRRALAGRPLLDQIDRELGY